MSSEKKNRIRGSGPGCGCVCLKKRKRVRPCWAEPVCCHDFRVYTCKRASSGGKSPEEAVKSNAAVHVDRFHNGLLYTRSAQKSTVFLIFSRKKVRQTPGHRKKPYAMFCRCSLIFSFRHVYWLCYAIRPHAAPESGPE